MRAYRLLTWGALLVLLIASLPLSSPAADVAAANPSPQTGSVDPAWWSTVQENIRRSEYQVTWQEQTYLADLPAAYQAPNRAHNLRTYFTPGGPLIIPRIWGVEGDAPPWRWELRLAGWGREGAGISPGSAGLQVEDNRVEYRYCPQGMSCPDAQVPLVTRYRNDEDGLALGFSLAAPPAAGHPGDRLRLDLALGGDLTGEVVAAGTALALRNADEQVVLRIDGLRAVDAAGQPLSASLALAGEKLSILVDDGPSAYPLQVELAIMGLPSEPDWTATGPAGSLYGWAVATAGDVNNDGYSDLIVGIPYYDGGVADEGRAEVYPGSHLGPSPAPGWSAEGNQEDAHFGMSVATAGDVNGDDMSDILVGAPNYDNPEVDEGGVWLYYGSTTGPSPVADNFDEGNQADARFGFSVASAGDVNGDGYADVIVGAPNYSDGQDQEGRVWVWHGSSDGISPSHNWHAEGEMLHAYLSRVSTAGDVNGDGYADVIVGALLYTAAQPDEGKAFLYYGNGGPGKSLRPRQGRAYWPTPIAHLGHSDALDGFCLYATVQSPYGRGRYRLEIEVQELYRPFVGHNETMYQASWSDWVNGVTSSLCPNILTADTHYHWRLRWLYKPGTTPFQPHSRWVTMPWNGWHETDLTTTGTRIHLPVVIRGPSD